MRYQNWDVLIFPGGSKIPTQEFMTSCHVIQDHESGTLVPSTLMLPTVTCFIPGLAAGFPFRVSMHSWDTPEVSRYTQNYSKHPENVMFEARIFIDGKLSGRRLSQRGSQYPIIIDSGLDRDRNGELEELRFPTFHPELLTHEFWNAGDDLGRIKVIISEGFPRDSMTMPLERVKNVVSFSFQHAPLEVLEASGIAWPNPAMWRQVPYNSAYLAQLSPAKSRENPESHSHSPRRKAASGRSSLLTPSYTTMLPPKAPYVQAFSRSDPFYDNVLSHRKASSTTSGDISMPDYLVSHQVSRSGSDNNTNGRRAVNMPQQEMSYIKQRGRTLQSAGAFEEVVDALLPTVPTNTPLDGATPIGGSKTAGFGYQEISECAEDGADIDPSLRKTLFENEIRSRKENHADSPRPHEYTFVNEGTSRNTSGPFATTNNSGSKRPYKAMDDMDQPRGSPTPRKVSLALSGIENIR